MTTNGIPTIAETSLRVRYAETDQMGESRMDRNVKRFFVRLHRTDEPTHGLVANY